MCDQMHLMEYLKDCTICKIAFFDDDDIPVKYLHVELHLSVPDFEIDLVT